VGIKTKNVPAQSPERKMKMKKDITHKFENVTGSISLDEIEIIAVSSKKNARVDLCIKANMNIPFAKIQLYSRDRFVDADACFDSAVDLGEEIERRWRLQAESEKLQARIEELEVQLRQGHHCSSFGMCQDAGEQLQAEIEALKGK